MMTSGPSAYNASRPARGPRRPAEVDPPDAVHPRRPAARRVGAAELLEAPHRRRQIGAAAAVLLRHEQADAAGRGEILDEIERQPPRRLDLGRPRGDP